MFAYIYCYTVLLKNAFLVVQFLSIKFLSTVRAETSLRFQFRPLAALSPLLPQRYICILLLFCEFDMCNMCIIHSEYESECRSTALLSGDAAITCTNVSHN
jgi:hypothetical protein